MNVLWMALIAYLAGAIPFSVWLGRLVTGKDVRQYGSDHNPGTANAWKAGTWRLGFPVMLLDFLKGAIPVWVARGWLGIEGWQLVLVALAPAIGHAYSIFLGFRGGKALAVTFGIWSGLTLAGGPVVLGTSLALLLWAFRKLPNIPPNWADAAAALVGMWVLLVYLLIAQTELPVLVVWAGNFLLLAWKQRSVLYERPGRQSDLSDRGKWKPGPGGGTGIRPGR